MIELSDCPVPEPYLFQVKHKAQRILEYWDIPASGGISEDQCISRCAAVYAIIKLVETILDILGRPGEEKSREEERQQAGKPEDSGNNPDAIVRGPEKRKKKTRRLRRFFGGKKRALKRTLSGTFLKVHG